MWYFIISGQGSVLSETRSEETEELNSFLVRVWLLLIVLAVECIFLFLPLYDKDNNTYSNILFCAVDARISMLSLHIIEVIFSFILSILLKHPLPISVRNISPFRLPVNILLNPALTQTVLIESV